MTRELYWVAAFPLAAVIFYLAVFRIDLLLLLIPLATPLAIVLNNKSTGPALSMPTEPLLFGIMLLFIFKFIFEGRFDKKILGHPVSLAIFFHIGWMMITCLTSTYPLISLKYLISQLWFIIPMYFLGTQLFCDKKNIKKFVWLYTIGLLIVIGYTIFRHAENAWTQKAAHWVMFPFYNDHTAYAAAIALFIPVIISFTRNREAGMQERFFTTLTALILIVAIVLSYTRAAWVSLIAALLVTIVLLLRIRFITVALIGGTLLSLFFVFQSDIFMKLEKNQQDSATDINKHIKSISNISTDASNLERINRWNSALRMFEEKPVFGWGPGTYQFNYAPFQKSDEMTIISTNAGNMGNAHSEYIGPLAEQGVLGMLAMVLIVVMVCWRAIVIFSNSKDKDFRRLLLGVFIGLVTYFVHGVLNNFLDTDKLAVPFWAFIAMIVAMDVYHRKDDPEASAGKQ